MQNSLGLSRRALSVIACGLCLVYMMVIVGLQISSQPKIGPIDELQHIDYLFKASHFQAVPMGDRVGEQAMRAEACRGGDFLFRPPPCHTVVLNPEDFQESGYDTAAIHPPTYYVTTGLIGRALIGARVTNNLITAGRTVGMLWLGAAVILLWVCMGLFKVSLLARSGVTLLLVTTPTILYGASVVNTDNTALVSGAFMLLAVLLWERRRVGLWVPALAGALTIALKATNMLAVGAAGIYLLCRLVQVHRDRRLIAAAASTAEPKALPRSPKDLGVAALAVGFATSAAVVAILVYQASIELMPSKDIPQNVRMFSETFPFEMIIGSVTWTPLAVPFYPTTLRGSYIPLISVIVVIGIVLAAAGAVSVGGRGSRLRALAISGLGATLLSGPLFVIVFYMTSHVYTPIPSRYALSALPFLVVPAAVTLDRGWWRKGLAIFGGIVAVATLVAVS